MLLSMLDIIKLANDRLCYIIHVNTSSQSADGALCLLRYTLQSVDTISMFPSRLVSTTHVYNRIKIAVGFKLDTNA